VLPDTGLAAPRQRGDDRWHHGKRDGSPLIAGPTKRQSPISGRDELRKRIDGTARRGAAILPPPDVEWVVTDPRALALDLNSDVSLVVRGLASKAIPPPLPLGQARGGLKDTRRPHRVGRHVWSGEHGSTARYRRAFVVVGGGGLSILVLMLVAAVVTVSDNSTRPSTRSISSVTQSASIGSSPGAATTTTPVVTATPTPAPSTPLQPVPAIAAATASAERATPTTTIGQTPRVVAPRLRRLFPHLFPNQP
jgi:hypothetical protein